MAESDEWLVEAFFELSTARSVTQAGPLPIPFEAVDRYASRYGIDAFDEFLVMIRAMDSAFLGHYSDG